MTDRAAQATAFRELHRRGNPIVLFNIWDAGSAQVVAAAGARALATGSWSVAAAHGFQDGEKLPLELAIENLRRIVAVTSLPVTVDLESGYGDVASTVRQAIAAGAIGFNLEDSLVGTSELRPIAEQQGRLREARAAADATTSGVFINARTDIFLHTDANTHSDRMVDHALERAEAYAQAGADGFFVPGLIDPAKIARICKECPLPVNVMAGTATNVHELANLGVARVSYGPGPYRLAMTALREAAARAIGTAGA